MMSPRLRPLAPTQDDWRIWVRLGVRESIGFRKYDISMDCDRRDAELMYRLTKTGADVDAMMITNEPFRATVHSLLAAGIEPRLAS
jgi:hypothetical protein